MSQVQPLPQRVEHRPESVYFRKNPSFPLMLAIRVTARYVARWATRYQAWAIAAPELEREGALPSDPEARAAVIDELLNWKAGPDGATGLSLYHEDERVLDQHDGPPAVLWLTPAEFEDLLAEFERHGIPRDAYYSVNDLRYVVEPVEHYGGIILRESAYSPLDWERRDTAAIASRRVPSEAERREVLREACLRFSGALVRRSLELHEPGKQVDEEELAENVELQEQVGRLIRRLYLQRVANLGKEPGSNSAATEGES